MPQASLACEHVGMRIAEKCRDTRDQDCVSMNVIPPPVAMAAPIGAGVPANAPAGPGAGALAAAAGAVAGAIIGAATGAFAGAAAHKAPSDKNICKSAFACDAIGIFVCGGPPSIYTSALLKV